MDIFDLLDNNLAIGHYRLDCWFIGIEENIIDKFIENKNIVELDLFLALGYHFVNFRATAHVEPNSSSCVLEVINSLKELYDIPIIFYSTSKRSIINRDEFFTMRENSNMWMHPHILPEDSKCRYMFVIPDLDIDRTILRLSI